MKSILTVHKGSSRRLPLNRITLNDMECDNVPRYPYVAAPAPLLTFDGARAAAAPARKLTFDRARAAGAPARKLTFHHARAAGAPARKLTFHRARAAGAPAPLVKTSGFF